MTNQVNQVNNAENLSNLYINIAALVDQRNDAVKQLVNQRAEAWYLHHDALINMAEGKASADDIAVVNLIKTADAETGKTVTGASNEAGDTFKQIFSTDKSGNWRCKPSLVGKEETIEKVKTLRNPWIAYDDSKAPKTTFEKAAAAVNAAGKLQKYEGIFSATALFNLEVALSALQSELADAQRQNSIGDSLPSANVGSLPAPVLIEKPAA